MPSSRVVYEGVNSILQSLKASDLDGAKKIIDALTPEVKNERDRGALLAASGIYSSIVKAKEGRMQSYDQERLARAARSITSNQMADDFDRGYAETLEAYSRLT